MGETLIMSTTNPIYRLVDEVREAVIAYDRTHDHTPNHQGDDCIRCKLVAALPPYAQCVILESAPRGRR